jgi:hypothetical protein
MGRVNEFVTVLATVLAFLSLCEAALSERAIERALAIESMS